MPFVTTWNLYGAKDSNSWERRPIEVTNSKLFMPRRWYLPTHTPFSRKSQLNWRCNWVRGVSEGLDFQICFAQTWRSTALGWSWSAWFRWYLMYTIGHGTPTSESNLQGGRCSDWNFEIAAITVNALRLNRIRRFGEMVNLTPSVNPLATIVLLFFYQQTVFSQNHFSSCTTRRLGFQEQGNKKNLFVVLVSMSIRNLIIKRHWHYCSVM